MSGTVYLIGAGPGAPDLLTLRAARLLGEADIVFHDALVHEETLALAARAQKVLVGKRCGLHSTAQRFINKRLVDAARTCKVVVRLKGGDPMLFGRAHEELACLLEGRIPFEIVPGVTAALAASTDLGISLTRRGVARSVVFATPRAAKEAPSSGWAKAVAAADTAVLYMAIRDAEHVMQELLRHGISRRKPIAVVENASTRERRLWAGDLAQLPELAARCGTGPALLVIGEVLAGAREGLLRDLAEPAIRQAAIPR